MDLSLVSDMAHCTWTYLAHPQIKFVFLIMKAEIKLWLAGGLWAGDLSSYQHDYNIDLREVIVFPCPYWKDKIPCQPIVVSSVLSAAASLMQCLLLWI